MKTALIIVILLLVSCRSLNKLEPSPNQIHTPSDSILKNARQITSIGENERAVFTSSADRLLFQSRNRPAHKYFQIYELDLISFRDRRITFQDADNFFPRYYSAQRTFFYSSGTDELKEHPTLLRPYMQNYVEKGIEIPLLGFLAPMEIYSSNLDGSGIKRWTHSPGIDGYISAPTDERVYYSSLQGEHLVLMNLNLNSGASQVVLKSSFHELAPVVSPDGKKLAWLRIIESNGQKMTQIMTSFVRRMEPQVLSKKSGWYWDLTWHPQGGDLIFSAHFSEKEKDALYAIHEDGSCLRQIGVFEGNSRYPNFSKDGKKLLFTNDITGKNQIYITESYSLTGSCLP